ncbi:MAG: glycolate oxidase subunit GlcF [Xanthobacteraceae bacterium]|nr:glycolate oxidase subunit GlcF [Xanthobacteraceae bacterium]
MQTNFTLAQLADPQTAEANQILRACVHCGFCTATCPTYVLLGDELDSPRGRIYLIKEMLERGEPASPEVVTHIDRCLSCLACMTTCPSGVHYMHLVDHARAHIEETFRRPAFERLLRALLARVLPDPRLFRLALMGARLARPVAPLLERLGLNSLAAMLRLAPARLPTRDQAAVTASGTSTQSAAQPHRRVALLSGCVASVLAPQINAAAARVLARNGIEVVPVPGEGCCGALVHHLGREADAREQARANIAAWTRIIEAGGLDAILITASGCGTMVKDYGFLFRDEPPIAKQAARVSALARDISEYLAGLPLQPAQALPLTVAYHGACSLQHGQKITREPKKLLSDMGFQVRDIPEGHLCCGSAGTYNMLQPQLARRLGERKIGNIKRVAPDVIAAGNVGCIAQIAAGTTIPVVHPVELVDWACGGPIPAGLGNVQAKPTTTLASDAAK